MDQAEKSCGDEQRDQGAEHLLGDAEDNTAEDDLFADRAQHRHVGRGQQSLSRRITADMRDALERQDRDGHSKEPEPDQHSGNEPWNFPRRDLGDVAVLHRAATKNQ